MIKKFIILITYFLLFIIVNQANSTEKINKSIEIQGDKQALEMSDIPLSEYEYDELSFFNKHFDPQNELLSLIKARSLNLFYG